MSYVIAVPEMMTAAATDLAGIGSELSEAHLAAAPPTVALMPAAADEVSAGVAHLFSRYAEDFHGLAAQAAAFNDQFVQNLRADAFSYTDIEAALTALLHHNLLDWLYSQYGVSNVVKVLADLELAIVIPILLVTSPIWIPLLLILSPLLLLFVILAVILAGA
jgi:PE family protein